MTIGQRNILPKYKVATNSDGGGDDMDNFLSAGRVEAFYFAEINGRRRNMMS